MIVFIRHGERADQSVVEKKLIETYFDPHLTKVGAEQAKLSGKVIVDLIEGHAKRFGIKPDEVEPVILSSPFLRCLMTARNICSQLKSVHKNTIFIQDEITEVMYAHDFDHDVLPELKIRVEDLQKLDKQYLNLGELNLGVKYFEDPRLIQPICPESEQIIQKRLKTFVEVFFEQVVKKEDFKKKIFICVTHQGVLQQILDAIQIEPTTYCDYCAIVQVVFPKADQGSQEIDVPLRGESFWGKK